MSFRKNISSVEAENFLKNLNSIMQENWLSQNSIADKMYPVTQNGRYASIGNRANFGINLKKITNGTPPTLNFVNRVATALRCSAESLLADTVTAEINQSGKDFIDAVMRHGFNLEKFSIKTGIAQDDLVRIVNRGLDKFTADQITLLMEKNFKLITVIPFAPNNIDVVSLIKQYAPLNPANVFDADLDWVYQRKAISQAALSQGLNINQLSLKTGFSTDYLTDNMLWRNAITNECNIVSPVILFKTSFKILGYLQMKYIITRLDTFPK